METLLRDLISNDVPRWRILELVRALNLPDCWVSAGFVRNAVWDNLHGRGSSTISGDVGVIWFDREADKAVDMSYEIALRILDPTIRWSVKSQARMHVANDDAPYSSATDAMRFWPEAATAVAVRRNGRDHCEIAAPFGLTDLFALVVRPTPRFASEKREIFRRRLETNGWEHIWPLLYVAGN